jgi:hypothetical protein
VTILAYGLAWKTVKVIAKETADGDTWTVLVELNEQNTLTQWMWAMHGPGLFAKGEAFTIDDARRDAAVALRKLQRVAKEAT